MQTKGLYYFTIPVLVTLTFLLLCLAFAGRTSDKLPLLPILFSILLGLATSGFISWSLHRFYWPVVLVASRRRYSESDLLLLAGLDEQGTMFPLSIGGRLNSPIRLRSTLDQYDFGCRLDRVTMLPSIALREAGRQRQPLGLRSFWHGLLSGFILIGSYISSALAWLYLMESQETSTLQRAAGAAAMALVTTFWTYRMLRDRFASLALTQVLAEELAPTEELRRWAEDRLE